MGEQSKGILKRKADLYLGLSTVRRNWWLFASINSALYYYCSENLKAKQKSEIIVGKNGASSIAFPLTSPQ